MTSVPPRLSPPADPSSGPPPEYVPPATPEDAAALRNPAPHGDAGEREQLEEWLDHHRATLALKCAGLTEAQLRQRPVSPSGLSLLGLVRHLAECERGWFRCTLDGEELPGIYFTDEDPDGDLLPGEDDTWAEAYATWQAEIALARRRAAAHSLDDPGAGRKQRDTGRPFTLRWIYLHMIEEYARHNGHADLLREALDGTTGA
ncbi:DinB family protein [Streptomyces fuscigenes]|uniref:DinB family protein n=1 Tax=Streptomyces fuscigenes TaxID=1528880 RepID=UPI001F23DC90|nr:DinB family protein [Streptomyces fuscigenes]MCF3963543.1 DinB family protein [Streptomyces fuscigenes]